ncbi:MAG TPA: DNA polymerase III subunit beta [Kofleriaceae bacterium]|nr:DNA polymerase III subunit beta [Kofleriaceae bacterium]
MEFRIHKAEFLKGLRLAQNIADRKSTMPMLANVLLRTSGKGQLLVAATDLNVSVSAELSCTVQKEGGLTASAKALHDIAASLPGDEITFKRADNNWAEISAGKVDYRLVGMPDRDFPKIPDHREVPLQPVSAETLRQMIDKTLFSVCSDETRFHLNGVYLESDGKTARMVSTDGHRLSKVERALPGAPTLTAGVILPKKGVVEIKRALEPVAGNCEIAIKTPYVFVRADEVTLAVKLIDSQFPPYEAVIPKANDKILEVSRALFADSLKRAQLMSSETRGVKLALGPGALRVASDNPDLGEVKEEIEATYDGPPVTIGVNPKYVLELLGQIQSDRVRIELAGDLDPLLVRPVGDEGHLGVIMPMRI